MFEQPKTPSIVGSEIEKIKTEIAGWKEYHESDDPESFFRGYADCLQRKINDFEEMLHNMVESNTIARESAEKIEGENYLNGLNLELAGTERELRELKELRGLREF